MLKKLTECIGVSGKEDMVRDFLKQQLNGCCTTLETDRMGNLHAINRGKGPEFLIITHMDEPGVIVTRITEDGYLCFEPIGRINPAFLVSKHVCFGKYHGVISLKAIHITTKKEREIPVKASQLFIDIGASSKAEAERVVEVGDYGFLDIPYCELQGGLVRGRAIAGRMGCNVALELLKKNPGCNIHVVFAVQREVKNRGVIGCGDKLHGDYTFVLDGIEGANYVKKRDDGYPEAGNGVAIILKHPDGILNKSMNSFCNEISKRENISLQYGIRKEQDTESTLLKMGQHNMISLAISVRYSDSVSPVAHIGDMDAMLRLTDVFIKEKVKVDMKCEN